MKTGRIKRLFGSVFTRLLLVILVTGFLINLLVIGFFGYLRHRIYDSYHSHLIQYINYITEDLGVPPDPVRAREIAQQASMAIRYTSPTTTWSTSDYFFSISGHRSHIWHESTGILAGVVRGGYFAKVRHGDGELLFQTTRGPRFSDKAQKAFVILICLLALLLVGAYFIIRWVLKPVRWLTDGVSRVGAGDLEYRVPEERADEFRDLAEAFNGMVERIGKAMHAREQLMLDVSHELRSPLTRLKIGLEMLPEGLKKESLREDIIEMEKMITDILEASRMQHNAGSLNRRPVDLALLIDALLPDFKDRPPGITVTGDLVATRISADREKAGTALRNIIDNAMKYSIKSHEPVEISLAREPGQARVTIRDHGIGIPVEDQPHIFEPFYRADKSRTRSTGGYGLGLSMCKTIMEAHGGSITLTSEEGQGTTVFLVFPV
ncbi:MAG: HAMP domain-containing histidine kinase [Desulfobacterales bacterium]|nr:HAMP domain-containing histidine kinase [Desulfobacterales bacterium]